MKNFPEYLKKLDNQALNSLRLVIILSLTLVFGVVLHQKTFSKPPAVARNQIAALASAKTAAYLAADSGSLPAVKNDENAVKSAPAEAMADENAQEGDLIQQDPAPNSAITASNESNLPASRNLSAHAAIVMDGDSGQVIFQKNAAEKLPMASLTKLMTAVVVSENLGPEDKVKISDDAIAQDGVAGGLKVGEEFTARDLMRVMLIVSSNDAARAFQDHFAGMNLDLIGMMNKKAEELGMSGTRFANPAGLDDENHYSTARDLAKLAAYILKNDGAVLSVTAQKRAVVYSLNKNIAHNLLSTNQLLQKNNPEIIGGKTGFTKNAQGCMASILKDGRVIIVLGSEDRFGETEKLIQNSKIKFQN